MAGGNVNWRGPELAALVRAEMGRRVDAAAALVLNRAKELLGVDGTGKTGGGRDERGKFRKSKLVYNANPSKPGEPPHVQTGRLRGSVAKEREGMVARVGTNVPYGRILELGIATIKARPWLRRALAECTAAVRALLTAPMK